MEYGLAALVGYLCGAIPVSLLVARRHGVDLRRTADGNPGAWNALEQLGPAEGLARVRRRRRQGADPSRAGALLFGFWPAYAAVAGAMVGHAFPLPHPSQGGKSIMCFVGGAFALSPVAAAVCAALALILTLTAGFAWGARVAIFAFPLVQLVTDPVAHVAATGVLMTFIGVLFVTRRRARASAATGETLTT